MFLPLVILPENGVLSLLPRPKGFFMFPQLVLGKETISTLAVFLTLGQGPLTSKDCFTIILYDLVSYPKVCALATSSEMSKNTCSFFRGS